MRAMRAFKAAKAALKISLKTREKKEAVTNASITPDRTLDEDARRVERLKAIGASSQRAREANCASPRSLGVEQQKTAQRIYHSHPASREAHGRTGWREG